MIDMAVIGPSKGTRPERLVAAFLECVGLSVRLNHGALPGSPDCWLPRLRTAVFCDGRFWHDPSYARARCRPHHRTDFHAKAKRNRLRDLRQNRELSKMGIRVIRIWDSSLTPARRLRTLRRLLVELERPAGSRAIRL